MTNWYEAEVLAGAHRAELLRQAALMRMADRRRSPGLPLRQRVGWLLVRAGAALVDEPLHVMPALSVH